jgi:nicotinamide-nucleotide adenylyltransferase
LVAVSPWLDLTRLLALRRTLRALDPDAPPAIEILTPVPSDVRSLAALPGSFNPPTIAHLGLARAALRAGCDAVVLMLSTRTVDKERPTGLLLEDRLLLLGELARRANARAASAALGVAVVNRGLYVDQAALLQQAWPMAQTRAFVVGYDKIEQIFDPRYYADRDAALAALFAAAGFLVAPRGRHGARALGELLARPENRRFASRVRYLPVPHYLRHVSSTQARVALPGGNVTAIPLAVRAFIRATGAFQPPRRLPSGEGVDVYAVRAALLDALERLGDDQGWDMRRLWRAALRDTPAGAALRRALAEGANGELAALLARVQGG